MVQSIGFYAHGLWAAALAATAFFAGCPLIFDLLTRLTALATTVALLLSKWFHCDTLSRRQKTLAVNIPHRGAQGPLHLLSDGAGINVEGEGEWDARKHGGQKRRV